MWVLSCVVVVVQLLGLSELGEGGAEHAQAESSSLLAASLLDRYGLN
jgi:hypothetical protein